MKYSREDFLGAVKKSDSISEALRYLDLVDHGGNYKTFHKYAEIWSIDTSHFTGQSWAKGKTLQPKRPIEAYLSNECKISSNCLKKRLIKEKIKDHKCEQCHLKKWNNYDIPIELHHIDGDNDNNNLQNLQILCPNCHAQTDNYRGNKRKKEKNKCIDCRKDIRKESKRCKSCATTLVYKDRCKRPPKHTLIQDLEELKTYIAVAKKYNVSDNSIHKWAKKYGLK